MNKQYKIIDILHTGNHGEEGVSKVGYKYDQRRNQILNIDLDDFNKGETLLFMKNNNPFLWTTPYVGTEEKDGKVYIRTVNSIYVTEEIKHE